MKRRSKDFLTGATPQKNEALIQDGLVNMTLVPRQTDRKKILTHLIEERIRERANTVLPNRFKCSWTCRVRFKIVPSQILTGWHLFDKDLACVFAYIIE